MQSVSQWALKILEALQTVFGNMEFLSNVFFFLKGKKKSHFVCITLKRSQEE